MVLQTHACAAKAGVDMLALECGGARLRVNSICSGPIEGTEGLRRPAPAAKIKGGITDSVPLGRFGQMQDIANAALAKASS
jgi:NAD(P)-dependent dehydrogenase (short-subunit alcohol dehydrogenase family)